MDSGKDGPKIISAEQLKQAHPSAGAGSVTMLILISPLRNI